MYIILILVLSFIGYQIFNFNRSKKVELEKKEKREILKDLFPNLYSHNSGLLIEVEKYYDEKGWLKDDTAETVNKILENEKDESKKEDMLKVINHLEQDWNRLLKEIKKKNITKQEREFLSKKFWKDHVQHFRGDIFYLAVPTLEIEQIIGAIHNIPDNK